MWEMRHWCGSFLYIACDFLGERLAAALGLKAAKYQYAIDHYYHQQKVKPAFFRKNIKILSVVGGK